MFWAASLELLNSITRLNMESLWNKLDQVYSSKQSIIGEKKAEARAERHFHTHSGVVSQYEFIRN